MFAQKFECFQKIIIIVGSKLAVSQTERFSKVIGQMDKSLPWFGRENENDNNKNWASYDLRVLSIHFRAEWFFSLKT